MSLPVIFAFGAMLSWGIGDFLIQRAVKKIGAIETLFWITFASSILLLPWAAPELASLDLRTAAVLAAIGLVGFTSGAVHLKALKIGKLAVVESILSLELAVAAGWGLAVFDERLDSGQLVILGLVLAGIIMLSVDFRSLRKSDWLEKGALLAVLSALIIGTVNFLTAFAAKELSPIMSLYLPWLFIGLICAGLISRTGWQRFWNESRPNAHLLAFTVLIDLAAWVFFALAVSRKELAVTVAITESYVVIAVLLGVVINKEKLHYWQYAGAALAVLGSIAMGLIT